MKLKRVYVPCPRSALHVQVHFAIIIYMNHTVVNTFSPLLQTMVLSCQADVDFQSLNRCLSGLSVKELSALGTATQEHGLFPLLNQALQNRKITAIDDTEKRKLKNAALRITQYNIAMSAELLQVMTLFKQAELDALAFKGPALSQFAYGNITLRQYGDLDILVKKESLSQILTLLTERGYTPEIALTEENMESFYHCVNVIGLYKGSVRIEIHWELLSKNYAVDWDISTLWSANEEVMINQQHVMMLAFKNHLLYLSVHGAKHLFERMEWICDIDRAVRSQEQIEWESLLSDAKALGVERMLLLSLSLAREFFETPLPQKIEKKIQADPKIEPLISKIIALYYTQKHQEKSPATFMLLWQMQEKQSDRLRFLYRGLFAPKFDDFKFIQLPKPLAFLYPLIRPYRLITKYFYK